MDKGEICLVIIFNHKYEGNINKLKYYYENRFKNIYFLMPFYKGTNEKVICVYESSYQFQGYLAQGYRAFYNEKFTHYIFIGDDLLLNPCINEDNICNLFSLGEDSGYIHSLTKLYDMRHEWTFKRFHEADTVFKSAGVNYLSEIPSQMEAERIAQKYNLRDFEIKYLKNYYHCGNIKSRIKSSLSNIFINMNITYPLVAAYSDIFIVPKKNIAEFCHLSGIFAAMNLFVEIAIPTALMLICDNIVMSNQLSLKAEKMWKPKDYEDLINKVECDSNRKLEIFMTNFPKEYAYLHPIKLSKWVIK